MFKISASIVSAPMAHLEASLRALEDGSADMIHFDIEDGSFVPAMNLGIKIIKDLRPLTGLPFDVHLMMRNPEWIIPDVVKFGANRIAVHYEACPYPRRTLELISMYKVEAGLAFNPSTPLPSLAYCLPHLKFVVILTTEPESGECRYLPTVLAKVKEGKEQKGLENIQWVVDGGITKENIHEVVACQADILVVGRGVFQGGTPQENLQQLRSLSLGAR